MRVSSPSILILLIAALASSPIFAAARPLLSTDAQLLARTANSGTHNGLGDAAFAAVAKMLNANHPSMSPPQQKSGGHSALDGVMQGVAQVAAGQPEGFQPKAKGVGSVLQGAVSAMQKNAAATAPAGNGQMGAGGGSKNQASAEFSDKGREPAKVPGGMFQAVVQAVQNNAASGQQQKDAGRKEATAAPAASKPNEPHDARPGGTVAGAMSAVGKQLSSMGENSSETLKQPVQKGQQSKTQMGPPLGGAIKGAVDAVKGQGAAGQKMGQQQASKQQAVGGMIKGAIAAVNKNAAQSQGTGSKPPKEPEEQSQQIKAQKGPQLGGMMKGAAQAVKEQVSAGQKTTQQQGSKQQASGGVMKGAIAAVKQQATEPAVGGTMRGALAAVNKNAAQSGGKAQYVSDGKKGNAGNDLKAPAATTGKQAAQSAGERTKKQPATAGSQVAADPKQKQPQTKADLAKPREKTSLVGTSLAATGAAGIVAKKVKTESVRVGADPAKVTGKGTAGSAPARIGPKAAGANKKPGARPVRVGPDAKPAASRPSSGERTAQKGTNDSTAKAALTHSLKSTTSPVSAGSSRYPTPVMIAGIAFAGGLVLLILLYVAWSRLHRRRSRRCRLCKRAWSAKCACGKGGAHVYESLS